MAETAWTLRIKHDKINGEKRGFRIVVKAPFIVEKGMHVKTTGGTMRLNAIGFHDGKLEISSQLHCAISDVGFWTPAIVDPGPIVVEGKDDCDLVSP